MVLTVLAAIDLDVHRLPDAIQLPAYPILLAGLALASWSVGDWGSLVRAALGGAIGFAFFLVLALVGSGMGFGDVKLAGLLGLLLGWLGWPHPVDGLAAAVVPRGRARRRAARDSARDPHERLRLRSTARFIAGALAVMAAASFVR